MKRPRKPSRPKVPSLDDKRAKSPPGRDTADFLADKAAGIEPGNIFAWRGEHVTAGPRGKVVAIVKRDLYRHRLTNIDDFDWLIEPPGLKTNVKDTPGFRELTDGRPQVCIDGEWRPALSPEGG